ncbi:MAG: urea transporter, partial [Deltaproteobacteria bacterium]|nr:urea transporter [Deltaproteobacteria bacterium]
AAIMAIFNNLLFGLGEVFHNNVWWSRVFAFRKGFESKAFYISGLIWFPIPIAAGFIAMGSGVLSIGIPSPDMVGPLVIATVLGKIGAIAVFVVVFCSIASSIDSLLAATADLVTEDIYRKIFSPKATQAKLKKTAQIVTLVLGSVTWLICVPKIGSLATVLFFAGPLVGSMIWPIITGLYWKRANQKGAISAMVLGSITGLICYFQIGWYVATLIATFVSMVCVLLFTYLSKSAFDWNILQEEEIS